MTPFRRPHSGPVALLIALITVLAWPGTSHPAAGPPAFTAMESPASGASYEPNMAVGPDGRVWISWLEDETAHARALRIARLEAPQWGNPIDVVSGDSLLGVSVDVPAILPMGGVRLVAIYPWKSPKGEGHDVRMSQTLTAGAIWLPPVVANRDATPTDHGFACLAADTLGARALWLDGRKSLVTDAAGHAQVLEEGTADMALRTAVLTLENRLADEGEVDPRVCDCCPTTAVTTTAGPIVAYRDRGPREIRDISVSRLDHGAWTAPAAVHGDGWKIAGCPVNGPALSAVGDRVAIAWFTGALDTARVLVAFSSDGGAHFGAPVRVDAGAALGRVAVAALDDGGAMVVWLEGGKTPRLRARRVGADRVAGPSGTVATFTGGRGTGIPRIVQAGGALVVAWTEGGVVPRVRTAIARVEYDPGH
ncbi:MAG: hypothetical protein HY076_02150 [Candidatus Eisenbacteria bacterium]|uniref:Exo-alpha-sialidase n=1 Tax=Eiseniibacteriota bacterium TaxID=2212470 RepID=A0A9D6L741_UNCEI|nr:hypothetical protein [Candidatus Eisenbacteria bacterium]MBI3539059.1 hypothetical protein [Candidatus Eisenbacteria bacterium]